MSFTKGCLMFWLVVGPIAVAQTLVVSWLYDWAVGQTKPSIFDVIVVLLMSTVLFYGECIAFIVFTSRGKGRTSDGASDVGDAASKDADAGSSNDGANT